MMKKQMTPGWEMYSFTATRQHWFHVAWSCCCVRVSGAIPNYAELARRGWVTLARITQIMNLLHLAAPIQEEILHWPAVTSQRDPVSERALRRLTRIPWWPKQLALWRQLLPAANVAAGTPVALGRA